VIKGCDPYFEVNIFKILKVISNEKSVYLKIRITIFNLKGANKPDMFHKLCKVHF